MKVLPDYQGTLLSYVGQQTIAHAAVVFAALTAGFTFATGFQNKITPFSPLARFSYTLILAFVFSMAAYTFGRMAFYGLLGHTILRTPQSTDHLTLTDYWKSVDAESSKIRGGTLLDAFGGFNWRAVLVSFIAGGVATLFIQALF